MQWTVERGGPVTTNLRIQYDRKNGWEQWGLLTADRHVDNPHSDLKLQKLHLDQAKERDAFVLDFGDFFDAMQGKTDRRASKRDLFARFAAQASIEDDGDITRSYLNALVDYGAQFLAPYLNNLALIGEGNHETSVDNKLEYNLLDGLIRDLNRMGGHQVIRGGYRGWIRFLFKSADGGSVKMSRNGFYFHGSGGGGPVTKGVIQASRKAAYLTNADYVFTGHVHENWHFPLERVRLTNSGREVQETQHHIQLPTYKQEYLNQRDGWHVETGKGPKPLGAWWIRFYWSSRSESIETQFIMADR